MAVEHSDSLGRSSDPQLLLAEQRVRTVEDGSREEIIDGVMCITRGGSEEVGFGKPQRRAGGWPCSSNPPVPHQERLAL
jgi:hypothetical protein